MLSRRQAAAILGITIGRLRYLETVLFPGSVAPVRYDARRLRIIRDVLTVQSKGISLQHLRRVLNDRLAATQAVERTGT